MKSFRIHAASAATEGRIPYLILKSLGSEKVCLDFAPLEVDPKDRVPPVSLTSEALYDVLSGRQVILERPDGRVTMSPGGEELLIECDAHEGRSERNYRVWLSEVGLGWNMLGPLLSRGS